jgi:hypothetical protein
MASSAYHIVVPAHLYEWMLTLPVIEAKQAKPVKEEGQLVGYEFDDETSSSVINGRLARLILNYMVRFRNQYKEPSDKDIKRIP